MKVFVKFHFLIYHRLSDECVRISAFLRNKIIFIATVYLLVDYKGYHFSVLLKILCNSSIILSLSLS